MSISLQKGQKVSLSKEDAGISKIIVGLGWDEIEQKPKGFFQRKPETVDCDASAIMLKNGRLISQADLVYFGNLKHLTGSVVHMGDNLTGEGDGDDEQIVIDLNSVPEEYDKIVIVVNIYDAAKKRQHFGMIKNAFVRLVDGRNGSEMMKYNLTDDYSGMMAIIFAEVYRHNGEWKFAAVGQGTNDSGLGELIGRYR